MLKFLKNWLFSPPPIHAPTEPLAAKSFFSTDLESRGPVERATFVEALNRRAFPRTVFDDYVYDPATNGKTLATFAQDSSDGATSIKAAFRFNQVGIPDAQAGWYGSQGFIGYQLCAIIAQNWLIQRACHIPARDAVRKGFKVTVNEEAGISAEVLAKISTANKRYKLNKNLVEFVNMGRVFGIRVAFCVIESDDPDYYVKPFNPDAITPGSYRGITQVDPYWCVPELTSASASDPSAIGFYEPNYWIINAKRYHKSHLVIMRGPEVADILKPSYLYGGLSVPQMIYERVYAAERTANEAPQLAMTKRSTIFYTDAAKALANQSKFEENMSVWRMWLDNYGVKIADRDADKVEQHETSLGDLDVAIMTQYQIVAAAAGVPVTKLMGTTPKGFNSSGDYEIDTYHEELESIQTNDMEPLIERHLLCVIRSEIAPAFQIAPFNFDVVWEPLSTLSAEELATINKIKAETYKILSVDTGAVSSEEIREVLAAEETSGFNGLAPLESLDDGPPV